MVEITDLKREIKLLKKGELTPVKK